jgi:hypothetical protein
VEDPAKESPETDMVSPSKRQADVVSLEPPAEEDPARQETVYLSFDAASIQASEQKASKKPADEGPIMENDGNHLEVHPAGEPVSVHEEKHDEGIPDAPQE